MDGWRMGQHLSRSWGCASSCLVVAFPISKNDSCTKPGHSVGPRHLLSLNRQISNERSSSVSTWLVQQSGPPRLFRRGPAGTSRIFSARRPVRPSGRSASTSRVAVRATAKGHRRGRGPPTRRASSPVKTPLLSHDWRRCTGSLLPPRFLSPSPGPTIGLAVLASSICPPPSPSSSPLATLLPPLGSLALLPPPGSLARFGAQVDERARMGAACGGGSCWARTCMLATAAHARAQACAEVAAAQAGRARARQ
jgi:hypothetical protein